MIVDIDVIFTLSIIIIAVNFLLGLLVYINNRKALANQIFFGLSISGAAWAVFVVLGFRTDNVSHALLYNRIAFAFAVLVPLFAFIHSYYFPKKNKNYKIFYPFLLGVAALTFILSVSPITLKDIEVLPDGGEKNIYSWGYFLFSIFYLVLTIGVFYNTYSKYRELDKIEKIQSNLLAAGFFIASAIGIIANLILPRVLGNNFTRPFGPLGIIFFIGPLTYGIMRYGLYNVKLIAAEFLSFGIWLIMFFQIFLADSFVEGLTNAFLFIWVVIFGILLIRTVNGEIEQRKKMEKINKELDHSAKLLVRRDLELTIANERLRSLDKAKSEFVSIAAHQLRTPLSAIKWALHMLLKSEMGKMTKEQLGFLGKTYKSNERMIRLVNDLLTISRIEEKKYQYKFTDVNFISFIKKVLFDFKRTIAEKNITFTFKKESQGFPRVTIDREKIREVFENLLDNAIKYTPRNGRITVAVTKKGAFLECAVIDTGIGIPKNCHNRIFDKFFRTANAIRVQPDGSGLGLSIIKSIIERHKGKIWFTSEEGKGSKFYFTLPID